MVQRRRVPGQLAQAPRQDAGRFDQTRPRAGEGAGPGCGKLAHLPQAQAPGKRPSPRWAKSVQASRRVRLDDEVRVGPHHIFRRELGKRRAAASNIFGPQVAEQLAHERDGACLCIQGVVHFDVHPWRRQTRAACLGRACYFL